MVTLRKLWVNFGQKGNGALTTSQVSSTDFPRHVASRARASVDRRVDMDARAHADVAEAWPTRPQRDFDASMRCGICGDFYELPVSFRGCHHAFCSDCVRRALPVMEKCPTCREPAEERDLVPNKALEHAVECYKRVRDELLGTTLAARDARARGDREGTTTTVGRTGSSAHARSLIEADEPSRPVIERDDEFVDDDDDDDDENDENDDDGGKKKKGKKGKKGKKKGGKKGKKGGAKKKDPKLAAAIAAGQLAAASVLRRMTMREDWAAAVARSEGARMLIPLLTTKDDQTRWHAQAALWNISGDVENHAVLREHNAPAYLTRIVPYGGAENKLKLGAEDDGSGRDGAGEDAEGGDDAEEDEGGDENED